MSQPVVSPETAATGLPGIITDPHWGYVWPSYVLAALCLIGLTVLALRSARRWAKRSKEAQAREAALAEERARAKEGAGT